MSTVPTLEGIRPGMVQTARLSTRVLHSGPAGGIPVLFLRGNGASATWWEETMLALPAGFRGIALDQRGFGDADPEKKVDATRGTGDWAEDAVAVLDALGIERAHVVGHSLGGVVVWRLMMDHPGRLLTAALVDGGSPFGYGGTRDADGTPCYADFAGSGGGLASKDYAERIAAGDRGLGSPFTPRMLLRVGLVKPPFVSPREEDLVSSMLTLHLGPQDFPGDLVLSPNWPYVAPGLWGAGNALSPKYAGDVGRLYRAEPKVRVLWIRGRHDLAVADQATSDPATLGQMGLIPGWPGAAVYPPQPMLLQVRTALERYTAAGGSFREVVVEDAGHSPFIERPAEFSAHLHAHLAGG